MPASADRVATRAPLWKNPSMSITRARTARPALFEVRSIDHIPEAERHGGLASQFTLWLAANLQITAIVTGALAVVVGGDVFWSLIALLTETVLPSTILPGGS